MISLPDWPSIPEAREFGYSQSLPANDTGLRAWVVGHYRDTLGGEHPTDNNSIAVMRTGTNGKRAKALTNELAG